VHSSLISRYLDAALRAARHAGLVVIVRLGSTGFAAILDTGLAAVLGGARADAAAPKTAMGVVAMGDAVRAARKARFVDNSRIVHGAMLRYSTYLLRGKTSNNQHNRKKITARPAVLHASERFFPSNKKQRKTD